MGINFSELELNYVNEVERLWWETGVYPTDELLSRTLHVAREAIADCLKKEKVRTALQVRGVSLPEPTVGVGKSALTTEQLLFANMLLNYHDKTSLREKLKLVSQATGVEVSTQQYHAWMRQPAFASYIQRRAEAQFKSGTAAAYQNVLRNVEADDLQAAKFLLEATGAYTPSLKVDIDVHSVVTAVLEAVIKHVRDPEILLAISADLESAGVLPSSSQPVGAVGESRRFGHELEKGPGFGESF